MLLRLFLLFTLVPLIELWLLLEVSSLTNPAFTVALVLVTGALGATLARRQGLETWQKIHQQIARGETPAGTLVDGLMIFIAGALLVTPGILTDVVGFGLLTPGIRARLKSRMTGWIMTRANFQVHTSATTTQTQETRAPDVIDAEFTRHPGE